MKPSCSNLIVFCYPFIVLAETELTKWCKKYKMVHTPKTINVSRVFEMYPISYGECRGFTLKPMHDIDQIYRILVILPTV